jgi:hypothetical protein
MHDATPAAIYARLEAAVLHELQHCVGSMDVVRATLALGVNMALSGVGRDGTVAELEALLAIVRRGGTVAVATLDDVQPQGRA